MFRYTIELKIHLPKQCIQLFLTYWDNALYRNGASLQLQINKYNLILQYMYVFSQKIDKYFLQNCPRRKYGIYI